jgi:tetratricopeptide (TPR) repeat protein
VGDFELAYRMHHRAGRAITRVIEGNVEASVRNEAIFRLARIYFQKDQPINALHAVERIERRRSAAHPRGPVIFLRAQVLMANGRFAEAAAIFKELQSAKSLEGFSSYNLGIALIKDGKEQEGRPVSRSARSNRRDRPPVQAIKDKVEPGARLQAAGGGHFEAAKQVFERVRLTGPFSNRALLASGWADAFQGRFDRALVPWSILAEREVTDAAVQEALLAVAYAYGKLNVYSRAALMYGSALDKFATKSTSWVLPSRASAKAFLRALVREELKQDANWVVKLRRLPQTPETYYLLELMASHDFQESLKNYLDLEQLRKRLDLGNRPGCLRADHRPAAGIL